MSETTRKTTPKPIPGAVEINGDQYLRNAQGDLTAVTNIKPMDLLMDEMVRKVAGYAEDLSAELARFAALRQRGGDADLRRRGGYAMPRIVIVFTAAGYLVVLGMIVFDIFLPGGRTQAERACADRVIAREAAARVGGEARPTFVGGARAPLVADFVPPTP